MAAYLGLLVIFGCDPGLHVATFKSTITFVKEVYFHMNYSSQAIFWVSLLCGFSLDAYAG